MFKKHKGSILAFSLIIMGIVLVAALGIAAVSVTEQKNAGTTAKSTQSFQVANSGSELLLQKVKGQSGQLSLISGLGCSGNSVTGSVSSGSYAISFYKQDGTTVVVTGTIVSGIRTGVLINESDL